MTNKNLNAIKKPVFGIYAKHRCGGQKGASIEAQLQICQQAAAAHGLGDFEVLVYSDDVTGTEQRESYARMKSDWIAGKFDVLMVDTFSRLTRDSSEERELMKMLNNHPRMRLMTADGMDTHDRAESQFYAGLIEMMQQHEADRHRHRCRLGKIARKQHPAGAAK